MGRGEADTDRHDIVCNYEGVNSSGGSNHSIHLCIQKQSFKTHEANTDRAATRNRQIHSDSQRLQ